jgi:hypothetical protein
LLLLHRHPTAAAAAAAAAAGPDVGGPNGPYRQSERAEIYKSYVDKLVAAGEAWLKWLLEEHCLAC